MVPLVVTICVSFCPPEMTADDHLMAVAVERFVYESLRPNTNGRFRFEMVLPDRQARWLRMLNSDDYPVRVEATLLLEEKIYDPLVRRTIIWGQFAEVRWPEVRFRCESLTYRYYLCRVCGGRKLCPTCGGTGLHPRRPDLGHWCDDCYRARRRFTENESLPTLCQECRGSGTPFPAPDEEQPEDHSDDH